MTDADPRRKSLLPPEDGGRCSQEWGSAHYIKQNRAFAKAMLAARKAGEEKFSIGIISSAGTRAPKFVQPDNDEWGRRDEPLIPVEPKTAWK